MGNSGDYIERKFTQILIDTKTSTRRYSMISLK